MRVVLLGPYPEEGQPVRGGIAAVLSALVPALVKQSGGGITVVGPGSADSDTGERADAPRVIRIAEAPGIAGWFHEHKRYRACLASLQYDVLHIQDPVHAMAVDCRRTPVVFTPHGRGKEEAAYMEGRMRLQQGYWIGHALRSAARRCTAAIAISGYQREWLESVGTRNIHSIPNPVAAGFFAPNLEGAKRERAQMLYVGRVERLKGFLDLLHALSLVRDQGLPVCLAVAGADGVPSGAYGAGIGAALKEHNLDGCITWLGMQTNTQLVEQYQRSLACVSPSYQETFGLGAAQALGCGRPAIVYDIPGVRDVVLHEETGLRVPLESGPEGLAEAMERLLRNPEEADKMGRRGREHVVSSFHPDVVAGKTLDLYEELLGRRRSRVQWQQTHKSG